MSLNSTKFNQAIVISSLLISTQLQAQTQEKMVEILLPLAGPGCTKQTKLIIPKGSNWNETLKDFQTCTQDMTIRVLKDGTLKINDGTSIWKGKLQNNAIQPI